MISIKSILVRHFTVVVVLHLIVAAVLHLSYLAEAKAKLALMLQLSESDLGLALSGLLGVVYLIVAWRLVALISGGLVDLVKRAESNVLNISVGPKATLMEVSRLGFVIESKAARTRELENLLDDAETNLERSEREIKDLARDGASLKKGESISDEIESLKIEAKGLEALNEELKKSLEEERSDRSQLADSKKELRKAESLLRLVEDIKEPSFAIKGVSSELQSRWEQLSFSRIRDDLAEIHRQSEIQTVAINKANASELP